MKSAPPEHTLCEIKSLAPQPIQNPVSTPVANTVAKNHPSAHISYYLPFPSYND